jgi:hypothetical protein
MSKPLARPDSVLVGPVLYSITYRKPAKMPDSDLMGQTRELDGSIFINTAQSDSTMRATLWHECLHAIANVFGQHRSQVTESYRLGNIQQQMTIEEMYVGFLEVGVLTFVRDNPDARAWILGY